MTLLLFDGFDRYSATSELSDYGLDWVNIGTVNISTTVPRGTGNSIEMPSNGSMNTPIGDIVGDGTTIICGAHFRWTSTAEGNIRAPFVINDSRTGTLFNNLCTLSINTTTDLLEFRRGRFDGTILATGTTALVSDTWYFIELKVKVNNSTGLFEVKLDGAVEIAEQTGLDTQGETASVPQYLYLGADSSGDDFFVDNFYMLDTATTPNNTYLGEVDIKMLRPNGDSSVAWTAVGAGTTNSDRVDEANPNDGDTTYVEAATTTTKDLYTLEDTGTTNDVFSVKLTTTSRREGSLGKRLEPIISVSATEQSEIFHLTANYIPSISYFDTSDGASTEWTAAALDSALIGYSVDT